MADCVRELAESGLPVPLECEACGSGLCKRDAEDAAMRIAELEAALRLIVNSLHGASDDAEVMKEVAMKALGLRKS